MMLRELQKRLGRVIEQHERKLADTAPLPAAELANHSRELYQNHTAADNTKAKRAKTAQS
jgi:hypothetical protein